MGHNVLPSYLHLENVSEKKKKSSKYLDLRTEIARMLFEYFTVNQI